MSEDPVKVDEDGGEGPVFRIRLPGFVSVEEIGLGDAITRGTTAFGARPCGGCKRRAAALNRWLAFTPRGR